MDRPWQIAGKDMGGGVTSYRMLASSVQAQASREQAEFRFAFGQFHLMAFGSARIVSIDRIVNPRLEQRYHATRRRFLANNKPGSELWVFHGTGNKQNQADIVVNGFKVGGQNGHPISNGAVFGQGVYTDLKARSAVSYGQGAKSVILCKGLEGQKDRDDKGRNGGDSWRPSGRDWAVFRHSQQVLPMYVLHFQ